MIETQIDIEKTPSRLRDYGKITLGVLGMASLAASIGGISRSIGEQPESPETIVHEQVQTVPVVEQIENNVIQIEVHNEATEAAESTIPASVTDEPVMRVITDKIG